MPEYGGSTGNGGGGVRQRIVRTEHKLAELSNQVPTAQIEFGIASAIFAVTKALRISSFSVKRGPDVYGVDLDKGITPNGELVGKIKPGKLTVEVNPVGVAVTAGTTAAELGVIGTAVHGIRIVRELLDAQNEIRRQAAELGLEVLIHPDTGEVRYFPRENPPEGVTRESSAKFLEAALEAHGDMPAAGEVDLPGGILLAGPLDPTMIPTADSFGSKGG